MSPNPVTIPIHREGWPFIGGFVAATAALFLVAGPVGWAGVVLSAWCVWFFRDPERTPPEREGPVGEGPGREGLVVSPADGVVLPIVSAAPPPELELGDAPRTRISIFMNVFNVHVNRVPCDGEVVRTAYRPGRFFNASFDKASEHNERMAVRIRMAGAAAGGAGDLAVVQIAGLVARRIKCYLSDGQAVRAGERFGIIRFGSRLDVYLPPGLEAMVAPGQRATAGETVLADGGAEDGSRQGEVR